MMTSAQIRQSFLDFFKSKDHTIVPSDNVGYTSRDGAKVPMTIVDLNRNTTFNHDGYFGRFDVGDKKRGLHWYKHTPENLVKIARRKRAAKKLKIGEPIKIDEALN